MHTCLREACKEVRDECFRDPLCFELGMSLYVGLNVFSGEWALKRNVTTV